MRAALNLFVPIAIISSAAAAAPAPRSALAELLSAEKAFSQAAAAKAPAEGLGAMLDKDVVLIARGGAVHGHDAAVASLAGNPANGGTGASWHSIRSGVSADGLQGFTMGYLDLAGGDPKFAHRRYIAYWVRGADGWRVAAFKQTLRAPDEAEVKDQGSIVPTAAAAAAKLGASDLAKSLVDAEQAFSDRAQQVGLYQAFDEFGRTDAIHLMGKDGFAIGRAAIAQNVGDPKERTSPVKWAAESTIVASSGDLGVTIDTIKPNGAVPEGQPSDIPYFTIWQRDSTDQPWRYIAE